MKKTTIFALLLGIATFAGAGETNPSVSFAPDVPPPITRKTPAVVSVHLDAVMASVEIAPGIRYPAWTFNGRVPGPMIRARIGDTLEMTLTNHDTSGMLHSTDFHAVMAPGGGALATSVKPGASVTVRFPLLHAGLFVYHCGTAPVADHLANGMYGLILVEPEEGLPHADREYYVLQSEFYTNDFVFQGFHGWQAFYALQTQAHMMAEGELETQPQNLEYDRDAALAENPTFVVFDGSYTALQPPHELKAVTGQTVRIFFGNAGPNKISSFHTIGSILSRVWREGDLVDPPAHDIQTTLVPAGGAAVIDLAAGTPGDYGMMDHSIFRMQKGAMGILRVEPEPSGPGPAGNGR